MKFQTAYNFKSGADCESTEAGNRYQDTFIETVNEYGEPCLKKSGSIDLNELHETGRELCDLKSLIVRFQRGDITALEQRDGFYADISEFPTTPAEVSKLAIEAKSLFMTQSASERAEYGNSVGKWLNAVMSGDEKALASIGIKLPPPAVEAVNTSAESATQIANKEVNE